MEHGKKNKFFMEHGTLELIPTGETYFQFQTLKILMSTPDFKNIEVNSSLEFGLEFLLQW